MNQKINAKITPKLYTDCNRLYYITVQQFQYAHFGERTEMLQGNLSLLNIALHLSQAVANFITFERK